MDNTNSSSSKLLDDEHKDNNSDKDTRNDMTSFINYPAEYANNHYSNNPMIKVIFVFLLLNPLFSLLIKKNKIHHILTSNQIRNLEITMIIILSLFLFYFNSYIDSSHQGYYIIKVLSYLFLILHLCLANDGELVRGFLEAKNKK